MACLAFPATLLAKEKIHVIKMESDEDGSRVWFDPIGLYVEPGATIRWVIHHNTHTVAAYHPKNNDHSLRIPSKAKPWNSDYLVEPGEQFEVTLTEPGVYDYYCEPHEAAGMVGRIVVGQKSGPGAQPYDYYKNQQPVPGWQEVPEAARCVFPDPDRIIKEKTIKYQMDLIAGKCGL